MVHLHYKTVTGTKIINNFISVLTELKFQGRSFKLAKQRFIEFPRNPKDQTHATTFRGLRKLPRHAPVVSGEILRTGPAQGGNLH